jgi:hypothetical protein
MGEAAELRKRLSLFESRLRAEGSGEISLKCGRKIFTNMVKVNIFRSVHPERSVFTGSQASG